MQTLKFSTGNKKMNSLANVLGVSKKQAVSFDLPAGYTCPAASLCKAYANKFNGKITDGKNMQFRCYAASLEAAFTNTRNAHWHNYDLLKGLNVLEMATLINNSLPKNVKVVRVHSSGDFFNRDYFQAWVEVAMNNPEVQFFGYTKVLEYVTIQKPSNFNLVYSFGGIYDSQVNGSVPTCKVVKYSDNSVCKDKSDYEASQDYFKIVEQVSFTLNLHGTQPARAKK